MRALWGKQCSLLIALCMCSSEIARLTKRTCQVNQHAAMSAKSPREHREIVEGFTVKDKACHYKICPPHWPTKLGKVMILFGGLFSKIATVAWSFDSFSMFVKMEWNDIFWFWSLMARNLRRHKISAFAALYMCSSNANVMSCILVLCCYKTRLCNQACVCVHNVMCQMGCKL